MTTCAGADGSKSAFAWRMTDATVMRTVIIAVMLVGTVACASAPQRIGMTMPTPSGCYVKVFDRERFTGVGDFINGAKRYATLNDLPNRANWSKRIRSAQVGPAAVVTVWPKADFKGSSFQMRTDRAYDALDTLTGQIQSMAVACTAASDGPSAVAVHLRE